MGEGGGGVRCGWRVVGVECVVDGGEWVLEAEI